MSKVVDLKKPDRCEFCGKEPSCYGWTCDRITSVQTFDDGYRVTFKGHIEIYMESWSEEPDDAA